MPKKWSKGSSVMVTPWSLGPVISGTQAPCRSVQASVCCWTWVDRTTRDIRNKIESALVMAWNWRDSLKSHTSFVFTKVQATVGLLDPPPAAYWLIDGLFHAVFKNMELGIGWYVLNPLWNVWLGVVGSAEPAISSSLTSPEQTLRNTSLQPGRVASVQKKQGRIPCETVTQTVKKLTAALHRWLSVCILLRPFPPSGRYPVWWQNSSSLCTPCEASEASHPRDLLHQAQNSLSA